MSTYLNDISFWFGSTGFWEYNTFLCLSSRTLVTLVPFEKKKEDQKLQPSALLLRYTCERTIVNLVLAVRGKQFIVKAFPSGTATLSMGWRCWFFCFETSQNSRRISPNPRGWSILPTNPSSREQLIEICSQPCSGKNSNLTTSWKRCTSRFRSRPHSIVLLGCFT